MRIADDGTYILEGEELEILADACAVLADLLARFPPDYPISEELLTDLCQVARRLTGH